MNVGILIKYIILLNSILLSWVMIWASDNIYLHIFSMVLLCIVAVWLAGFDLLHPYFWMSTVFTAYSIGYPVLYAMGEYSTYGYSKELMYLQWLALSSFLIVLTPKQVKYLHFDSFGKGKSLTMTNGVFNAFLVIIIIAVIFINLGGYTGKAEIYSSNNIFYNIVFSAVYIVHVLYVYFLIESFSFNKRVNNTLIIKTGISLGLITAFSGERDILFTFIVISILSLYAFKIIRKRHLILLGPLSLISIPLSNIYKYYLLTGVTSGSSLSVASFFQGEFVSASRNIMVLLNNKILTNGIFNGSTLIHDAIRAIAPSTSFSSVAWYKQQFFSWHSVGYGFTLVGEGYINWGYLGVVVVFVIVGLFVKFIYYKSNNNLYTLTIYISTIPLCLYGIRADLANIFSPFVKHILFSIFIIYFLDKIVLKKNRKLHDKNSVGTSNAF